MSSGGENILTGRTVVVVDDDDTLRNLLCHIIRDLGLHVVGEGKNGYEALELFRAKKPDVICLDIEMPEMNGTDALLKIRELDSTAIIVMITASTTEGNVRSSIAGRANGMIAKPLSTGKIAAELNRVLSNVQSVVDRDSAGTKK